MIFMGPEERLAQSVALGAAGGVCGSGACIWFICFINASRAAAWAALSWARTEPKPAQKANTQTADSSLVIFMALFYANFAPDATAFRPATKPEDVQPP